MRQGIDISDIEEETKIRAKFLRALENEEWQVIPEDVYVRKFLETYAASLGLDPRPLVELYVIRSGSPDPAMTFKGLNDRDRERLGVPRWVWAVVAAAGFGLLLLIGTGTL
jgi:cytoskeletal protein RodZ